MIFDVDTLVEEVLSAFIYPDEVRSMCTSYLPLRKSDFYLMYGPSKIGAPHPGFNSINAVQLVWFNNKVLNRDGGGLDYFSLVFEPEKVGCIASSALKLYDPTKYKLTSLEEWQTFFKQYLPKFIKSLK